MKKIAYLFLFSIILLSCKDDDVTLCGSSTCYDDGLFILNEGLFQNANSSVTFYNPQEMQSEDDIYFTNNIVQIGDILNSGYRLNDVMYLVVNNSQKILKVNPSTFELIETIQVSGSPRRFLAVSDEKAYVTDLFGSFHIVDLSEDVVSSSINLGGWTEEMVLYQDYVYITKRFFDSRKSSLIKFNKNTDQVEDSLQLPPGAGSIVQDVNLDLWVLCGGDTAPEDSSALFQIDVNSFSIIKSVGITDKTAFGGPSELFIDGDGNTLYYLNVGLYKLDVSSNQQELQPFISAAGRNFYDFSIDYSNGEIYICDPVDFVQSGVVYRYDNSANLIDQIAAGVTPGEIVF